MKTLATYTTIAFMWALAHFTYAQAPAWSVDPTQYQNSMNITALIIIDQQELDDDNDLLGAFVGSELRGVAQVNVGVASTGKKVAFLQVYSNVNAGETLTFKAYDASENVVMDAITEVVFNSDDILGTTANPFIIADNSPPTNILLSDNEVDEAQAIGTLVGTLSSVDKDSDETFTYTLVTGEGATHNDFFAIETNLLRTARVIKFETNPSLSVRIRTTDSRGASFEKSFIITVNDVNNPPTALNLSNATLPENTPVGTVIGEFTVTDEDVEEVYGFTLVSGVGDSDNEKFSIVGNTLRVNALLDYETQVLYNIRVTAESDEGGIISATFVITLTDVNEPPTSLTVDQLQFNENIPIGTIVATFSATDPDAEETFTYSFVGNANPDHAAFSIEGDKLLTAALINYEQQASYRLNIRVTDSGDNTLDAEFVFRVLDQNDPPTAVLLDKQTIQENLNPGALVGRLSTTDEDVGDQHTYRLVDGEGSDDNALFLISGNQLLTNVMLDYETATTHTVRIESSDGSSVISASFVITVIDTNDDPTGLTLDHSRVDENAAIGTVVGSFTLEDVDIVRSVFTMIPGTNDNARFAINGDDLITAEVFDFETKNQYNIDVQGADGAGGLVVRRFVISINDINESPTALFFTGSSLSEDTPIGTLVGELSTEDEDFDEAFTYRLGNHEDVFAIEDNRVVTIAALDHATASEYELNISSTDKGGNTIADVFTITVIEVIPPNNPPVIGDFEFVISENAPINTVIGTVEGSDPDGDEITYTLRTGFDNEPFDLDRATGIITLRSKLDYSRQNSYRLTVVVTDPEGLSDEGSVMIFVEDEIGPELMASDFVSANNDGINDTFIIQSPGLYSNYRLTISNGSRIQVFTTIGYNNDWSGTTSDGVELPKGLYYYSLKSPDGSIEYTGTITLVR